MSPRTAPYRRRSSLLGVIAGAATLVLVAGCSSGTPSTSETTGAAGAPGGNLVIGMTSDPNTLLPWKATQFQAVNILQNVYGTLTEFDKDLNVVPGLAQSWDPSADGKTVTLKLRSGVTFADGSVFDSADVKSSMDKIMDEKTAAVARTSLASVASVAAPDPSTVVLTMKSADASLPANLASVNMAMLSSTDTDETLTTKPNGTGPYSFKARTPSQSLTLQKNASYWGPKATLDSVEFRVIPDETSIVSALQSGSVQMAVIDDPLVAKTAEGGSLKVAKTPQLSYHALQLNARKGDLTDVNVRLAIQCTIDRKQVLDTAALGEGEVTRIQVRPELASLPEPRPGQGRRLPRQGGQVLGDDQDHRVAGRVCDVGQRGPEPQGPAGRGEDQPRPAGPRVRRLRRPLGRRRLRRRGGPQRWPARPRRHVRPLLHQHRQPQQGGRLQLARARRALRAGQDHE